MFAPGMIVDLHWAAQTAALLAAVRQALPQCRTVAGMESLDFAECQPDLLPAAYVCWAGDTPVNEGSQGAQPSGQVFERQWLVFLMLELVRETNEALALTERLMKLFGLYFLGILLAVLLARLFKKTLFKVEDVPFVMELPPYRMPSLDRKSVV